MHLFCFSTLWFEAVSRYLFKAREIIYLTVCSQVGRIIMADAAKSNLKKVSLELGGKSPLIVFNDADGLYFSTSVSLHYSLVAAVLIVLDIL